MADAKLCFVLAIFVALFSFGHSQTIDYQILCGRTTMSTLCNEIIHRSISDNLKTYPIGMLTILSDKAKSFALSTQTKIGDALRQNPTGSALDCLKTCSFQYSKILAALHNLEWRNVNHNNFEDYNAGLGQALDAVNACMNVFSQPPAPIPAPSPISLYSVDVKMVIEVTLQFLNLCICDRITACALL